MQSEASRRSDATTSGATTHLERRGCTVAVRDLEGTRNRGSVPKRDPRSRRPSTVYTKRRSQVALDWGWCAVKLGVHTRRI